MSPLNSANDCRIDQRTSGIPECLNLNITLETSGLKTSRPILSCTVYSGSSKPTKDKSQDKMTLLTTIRGKRLSRLVAIIGAFAFCLQGYDQAVANGLLTLPSFIKLFPQIDTVTTSGTTKSHNATIQGTTVAIYEIGCALGALSCMELGDRLGRKKTIFMSACIVLVGVAIQATPFTLAQLIVGRVITGMRLSLPRRVDLDGSRYLSPGYAGRIVLCINY